MATISEFTVAAGVFPLGTVFEDLPNVRVELERLVPTDTGIIPYFWVRGVEVEDIVAHFSTHPGVRDIRVVDSFTREYLMRCEWPTGYVGILSGLSSTEISLLSATGTTDEWRFEVRGDTREAIAEFQRYCNENGIPITVVSLQALTPVEPDHQLTAAQQEALLLAFESGFYDSPRTTTLAEIGDELEISQQAVSSRLRRGTRRLIANTLARCRRVDTVP